jgi:hypothetical protein
MSRTDLDRFEAACVYPGKLDEQAVERELAAFLQALGMHRRVVRLRPGWRPHDDPPRNRDIKWILAECVSRYRYLAASAVNIGARDVGAAAVRGAGDAARYARGTRDAGAAALALSAVFIVAGHPDHDPCAPPGDARATPASVGDGSDLGLADHALVGVFPGLVVAFPALAAASSGVDCIALSAVLASYLAVNALGALFSGARLAEVLVTTLAATAVLALSIGVGAAFSAHATVTALATATALAALSVRAFFALRASLAARAFATFADPALTSVTGAANPGARALRAGWGSLWDLSWRVCALFDRKRPAVEAWLRPLFEAFACGCWLLYWAGDTLYWVAKPTVHREPGTQRLHHDTHAALASDFVNLHFWHGVMVPAFVIARPDLITLAHIDQEQNAEVRRVMIERYRHGEDIHGAAAFIRDAGGERLDHDERYGTLWRRRIRGNNSVPGDEPIVMIEVVNRTREPDGRFRHYWLRVPPTMRTAREAVAWTFNTSAERYAPVKET